MRKERSHYTIPSVYVGVPHESNVAVFTCRLGLSDQPTCTHPQPLFVTPSMMIWSICCIITGLVEMKPTISSGVPNAGALKSMHLPSGCPLVPKYMLQVA